MTLRRIFFISKDTLQPCSNREKGSQFLHKIYKAEKNFVIKLLDFEYHLVLRHI